MMRNLIAAIDVQQDISDVVVTAPSTRLLRAKAVCM